MPKLLRAVQEAPSHPPPYRCLAACYAHMGRLAEARELGYDIICHCRSEEEARRLLPWRSASGPVGWFFILRRPSSSIVRIPTGVATFRSSRLTFSATPFVRDKRSGVAVAAWGRHDALTLRECLHMLADMVEPETGGIALEAIERAAAHDLDRPYLRNGHGQQQTRAALSHIARELPFFAHVAWQQIELRPPDDVDVLRVLRRRGFAEGHSCGSSTPIITCGIVRITAIYSRAARRCRQRPQHPRHMLRASSRDVSRQRAGGAQVARRNLIRQRRRGNE